MPDRDPRDAQLAIARNALPALVTRMGGEVTITAAELETLGRAFGGFENLAVEVEQTAAGIHFKVVRNPASLSPAVPDDPRLAEHQTYQQLLAQVDALTDRVQRLRPRPGSQADVDTAAPSLLRRLAWQHGTAALVVACDSMRGLRLMARGLPRPVFAHFALLRAAVEGASLARWLFDPRASDAERTARGLRAELEDLTEQEKAERYGRGTRMFPTVGWSRSGPKRAGLDELAEAEGVTAAARADLTPSRLAEEYASFPDDAANTGRWLYTALSAAAHGRRWVLQQATTVAIDPDDPTKIVFASPRATIVARTDAGRIHQFTAIVLDHLTVACQDAERYAGLLEAGR